MTEKNTILHILRDTLQFHKEMGIAEYHDSPEIRKFLNRTAQTKGLGEQKTRHIQVEPISAKKEFVNLADEISSCTLCKLAGNSLGRVIGRGKPGCRLLFIGDYSSQSGDFSTDTLFSREEDEMLWKMIEAINLQPEQVYVTNSLKCCPSDPGKITTTCEEKCFAFLAREIAAVSPDIICAMGDMAARVILGRKDSLARVRGRFFTYRSHGGKEIAVMPTFHPRFLLQQQEMKKATWNDLQAIMARLGEA